MVWLNTPAEYVPMLLMVYRETCIVCAALPLVTDASRSARRQLFELKAVAVPPEQIVWSLPIVPAVNTAFYLLLLDQYFEQPLPSVPVTAYVLVLNGVLYA